MECSLVRMTVMLCLFLESYAMTSETTTMTTRDVTNTLTTVASKLGTFTEQTVEETILTKGVESDITLTTPKYDLTTNYVKIKAANITQNLKVNETTDLKTTVTLPRRHSTILHSTTGHYENVPSTEGVRRTTQTNGHHSTQTGVTDPLIPSVTKTSESSDRLTANPGDTVHRTMQTGVEADLDQKYPQVEKSDIDGEAWDWYDTQTIPSVKKSKAEISSVNKESEEDNLYYNSPQYIQRRTINHAAVWITVGFVAILLTYILALFIHEKGRSEWKLATQNYSRFENEVTQEDNSSLTIDMDEPSTPFTVTSSVIETTSTQNLMLKPSVVNTRKSY